MTYACFIAELGKAGLSVSQFADLVCMNRNSVSNYSSRGEVPQHLGLIAALLGAMNVNGVDFKKVVKQVNATPKKPRGRAVPGRFGGDNQEQFNLTQ